jgi:hypothetical protein
MAERRVAPPEGFAEEVFDTIRPLSLNCREGAVLVAEGLRRAGADADERCGLLADRHEVFALRIPRCAGRRLAASFDLGARPGPAPVTIHGAVPARGACAAARRLATRHLRLTNPVWEGQK